MTAGLPVTISRAPRLLGTSLFVLVALGAALAGCSDEEETATAEGSSPPPAGVANRAPTISGTPQASVSIANAYQFDPAARDADGDVLTFRIAGRPRWATFSTATGRLSGIPAAADVGTYSNILISVTDGAADATLAAFAVTVVATASGSAMLSWAPPTQNTDGSPLGDLAGYRIYWGTVQGNLTNSVMLNNPGLTSYVVPELTPATWYFATTAVNSAGAESGLSNIVSKAVL